MEGHFASEHKPKLSLQGSFTKARTIDTDSSNTSEEHLYSSLQRNPSEKAFTEEDVHKASKIFSESYALVADMEKLAGELGLSFSQVDDFWASDPKLDSYGFFKKVLTTWISKEKSRAKFGNLVAILRRLMFHAVADSMEGHFASEYKPKLPLQGLFTKARKIDTNSSNTSEEHIYSSLQRRELNIVSSSADIAKFLYERNLKAAFESLKLMNQKQVQNLITEVDSNQQLSERGPVLANAIDCLIEIGRYDDILNICKEYGQFSLNDFEYIEVDCHRGWALLSITRNDEALSIFQKSKRSLSRILGENDYCTLKATVGYAITLSELGRNEESDQCLKTVIAELDKDLPVDPITLKAKLYQAIVCSRLGNYPLARDLCSEICKKQQEIERDCLSTVEAQYHLALIKLDMKNFDEALPTFDEVYKACARLNLKNHPIYIRTCYKMAQTYSSLGRNKDALELVKDVKQNLNILGDIHEDALKIRRLEAQVFSRLGQYDKAVTVYKDVHKIQENSVGIEHASTLETKYQMGINLTSLKLYDDALNTFAQVHKSQKRTLGIEHPSTLRTESHIAAVHCEMGRYDDSIGMLNNVIKMQDTKLQENHPDTLRSKRFLAQNLAKKGKFEEAEKLLNEIRPLHVKYSSENHPSPLETGFQLGVALKLANKFDDALNVLERVHRSQSLGLGDNHPLTLITHMEIAIIHSERGDQQKAITLLEKLIQLPKSREESQLSKIDLLTAQGYYGKVLSRMDRRKDAIKYLTDVKEKQTSLLGIVHPATLETKYQIGLVLSEMCAYDDALKVLYEIDRVQSTAMGESHPATLRTKTDLAKVLSDIGSNDESLRIFNEIKQYFDQNISGANIDMLRAQRYLARTRCRLGYYEHALIILGNVERMQITMLTPEHPSLLETKYQIGQTYKVSGKQDLALGTFQDILKDQQKADSDKQPSSMTLRTRVSICGILVCKPEVKPEEALRESAELVDICASSKLGTNHRTTLTAKRHKAQALSKCGKFEDAVKLFDEVRGSQEQEFGFHHPQNLETIIQQGICLETMGHTLQALDNFELVLKIREHKLRPEHPDIVQARTLFEGLRLKYTTEVEAKKKPGFRFFKKNK